MMTTAVATWSEGGVHLGHGWRRELPDVRLADADRPLSFAILNAL
jgi:hypothetical protein